MSTASRQASDPPRVGRPSQDMAERLSDHMLGVATAMFAREGYAKTSIARLAVEARVGKHSIYRRYSDKAALFRAVVRRQVERIAQAAEPDAEVGQSPLERLRRIGLQAAQSASDREWVALYRAVLAEAGSFPELAETMLGDEGDMLIGRCAELVAAGQAAKLLKSGDPLFIARQFLHSMGGPLLHRCLARPELQLSEADVAFHAEAAWTLFVLGAGHNA